MTSPSHTNEPRLRQNTRVYCIDVLRFIYFFKPLKILYECLFWFSLRLIVELFHLHLVVVVILWFFRLFSLRFPFSLRLCLSLRSFFLRSAMKRCILQESMSNTFIVVVVVVVVWYFAMFTSSIRMRTNI